MARGSAARKQQSKLQSTAGRPRLGLSRSLLYLQIRKPVFREYRFVAADAYRRTVARVRLKRIFRLADYNRMFLLEPTTRGNNLASLSPLSTVRFLVRRRKWLLIHG